MKCPRCVQRIHRAAVACPHCGFTIGDADRLFGKVEVKLRSLTDVAGLFRRNDRDKLEERQEKFMRTFPQLFFAIYTGSLGETGNMRQFGFWLLNRGVFEDVPMEMPNECGILLVIDPDTKSAGMSFGYMLDAFLEEADTFECLSRAHSYWLQGKYGEGVLRCMGYMERLLKQRCRQARRDVEKFERRVATPAGVEDLVKKIRSGHVGQEPAEREEGAER